VSKTASNGIEPFEGEENPLSFFAASGFKNKVIL